MFVGHLWELVVVLLIALIFVGPKRLPELGSSLGKSIREFRKSTHELQEEITGETTAALLPAAEQRSTAGDGASTAHTAAEHAAASPPQNKEAMRT